MFDLYWETCNEFMSIKICSTWNNSLIFQPCSVLCTGYVRLQVFWIKSECVLHKWGLKYLWLILYNTQLFTSSTTLFLSCKNMMKTQIVFLHCIDEVKNFHEWSCREHNPFVCWITFQVMKTYHYLLHLFSNIDIQITHKSNSVISTLKPDTEAESFTSSPSRRFQRKFCKTHPRFLMYCLRDSIYVSTSLHFSQTSLQTPDK